jgi:hypothetical protein
MRTAIRLAAKLLVSLVLVVVVAELTLWALGRGSHGTDRRELHEPRPDKEWLYGLRPGATGTFGGSGVVYRVNADGLRDRAYQRPKPPGVFRILVLGDSVAFGYGVELEDTLPERLEKHLDTLSAREGGGRVEVLNLAVGGYNPYNEAALLDDVGAGWEPDLVLVQFCVNDLNDPTAHFDVQTRLHLGTVPDAAYPDPSTRTDPPAPPGRLLRLCRTSRLCSLVDDAMLAADELLPQERDQGNMMRPVESDDGPEWPWLERTYRRMAATSRGLGAGFAVLAFPYRAQLDGPAQAPVQSLLVEMGRRQGWPVIDPLERFRAAQADGRPVFLDWWHPSPLGNGLAAAETARTLSCAGLLTAPLNSLCAQQEAGRSGGSAR